MAGVALLGVMSSSGVMAQSSSSLMSEFGAAAEEFDVPVELLVAMGWVNTRWEMPPPETSEYEEGDLHGIGLYGIMALVQNPSSNTLGEAAELTGIPEEELKSDRAANIRGGAALLAKSRRAVPGQEDDDLSRATQAVEGAPEIDAVAGVGGGELYQEQVLEVLRSGVSGETGGGEKIELAPQEVSG
ncbi:MAG: hypothetical protein ACRDSJ_04840 [Rubrobacteraceae bacterium]